MSAANISIVEAYCAAYVQRDYAAVLDLVEDDICAGLLLDRTVVPFAGWRIGKQAFMRRMKQIDGALAPDKYCIIRVRSDAADLLETRIFFRSYYRNTGNEIDGTIRIEWRFRNDRVMRVIHHHDRSRCEAFFRLMAAEEAGWS